MKPLQSISASLVLLASFSPLGGALSYAQTQIDGVITTDTVVPVRVINAPASNITTSTSAPVTSTTSETARVDPHQDFCISVITGFPNDDQVSRYQFFKLTDELAVDADPEFVRALQAYQGDPLPTDIPVLDVIETIANPVLRQAAPEIVVASMHHLIDFNQKCDPYLVGQISSLTAFDATLKDSDIVIAEDALYLRQILLDSLSRLGVDNSAVHKTAALNYSNALVRSRDAIEFQAYEDDVSDVEAIFMNDLDGRLARSNDIINSEIDREAFGDAVTLSNDLIADLKRKEKEQGLRTLSRILNRRF